jgi:hypothetical protein
MGRFGIILCVVLLIAGASGAVHATATPAPTATPMPSPTPDVIQFWTSAPRTNDAGTPIPAQDMTFAYSANAGDVGIALLIGAILFSLIAMFTIWVLVRRGDA